MTAGGLIAGWRRKLSTTDLERLADYGGALTDDELDAIGDELERRAHDLDDPSSGLRVSPPLVTACPICRDLAESARHRADSVALAAVRDRSADMAEAGRRCADLETLAAKWDELARTHDADTHRT